jgi:hypothetical protein
MSLKYSRVILQSSRVSFMSLYLKDDSLFLQGEYHSSRKLQSLASTFQGETPWFHGEPLKILVKN